MAELALRDPVWAQCDGEPPWPGFIGQCSHEYDPGAGEYFHDGKYWVLFYNNYMAEWVPANLVRPYADLDRDNPDIRAAIAECPDFAGAVDECDDRIAEALAGDRFLRHVEANPVRHYSVQVGDVLLTKYEAWPPWPVRVTREESSNDYLKDGTNNILIIHVVFLQDNTTLWVQLDAVCRYSRNAAKFTRVRESNKLFDTHSEALFEADAILEKQALGVDEDEDETLKSCKLRLPLRPPALQKKPSTPLRLELKSPFERREVASEELDPKSEDDFFNTDNPLCGRDAALAPDGDADPVQGNEGQPMEIDDVGNREENGNTAVAVARQNGNDTRTVTPFPVQLQLYLKPPHLRNGHAPGPIQSSSTSQLECPSLDTQPSFDFMDDSPPTPSRTEPPIHIDRGDDVPPQEEEKEITPENPSVTLRLRVKKYVGDSTRRPQVDQSHDHRDNDGNGDNDTPTGLVNPAETLSLDKLVPTTPDGSATTDIAMRQVDNEENEISSNDAEIAYPSPSTKSPRNTVVRRPRYFPKKDIMAAAAAVNERLLQYEARQETTRMRKENKLPWIVYDNVSNSSMSPQQIPLPPPAQLVTGNSDGNEKELDITDTSKKIELKLWLKPWAKNGQMKLRGNNNKPVEAARKYTRIIPKYVDAICQVLGENPGWTKKPVLLEIRRKFCTDDVEPEDWPGDPRLLNKIANYKAKLRISTRGARKDSRWPGSVTAAALCAAAAEPLDDVLVQLPDNLYDHGDIDNIDVGSNADGIGNAPDIHIEVSAAPVKMKLMLKPPQENVNMLVRVDEEMAVASEEVLGVREDKMEDVIENGEDINININIHNADVSDLEDASHGEEANVDAAKNININPEMEMEITPKPKRRISAIAPPPGSKSAFIIEPPPRKKRTIMTQADIEKHCLWNTMEKNITNTNDNDNNDNKGLK